jgi:hypothetical protein
MKARFPTGTFELLPTNLLHLFGIGETGDRVDEYQGFAAWAVNGSHHRPPSLS